MQVVKGDDIVLESGNAASSRPENRVLNDVDRVGRRKDAAFIGAPVVDVRDDIVGSCIASRP